MKSETFSALRAILLSHVACDKGGNLTNGFWSLTNGNGHPF